MSLQKPSLSTYPTKKISTPLKPSVVLLTSVIFASVSAYAEENAQPTVPVNPDVAAQSNLTGFQSNAIGKRTGTSIRYTEILENDSDSYDQIAVRADQVASKLATDAPIQIEVTGSDDKDVGNGFKQNEGYVEVWGQGSGGVISRKRRMDYTTTYKNFDDQMQIGHVHGDLKAPLINVDEYRLSNVYVQGNATDEADIDFLQGWAQHHQDTNLSEGVVQYTGDATYMENLHLKDGQQSSPVVNGTSEFNVDFVKALLEGTLSFQEGDYKYMPEGNQIGIKADISGNTFKGNYEGIDTAGGFYGEDGRLLGGIYQQALTPGGGGSAPGEGTTFQGTFGASKTTKTLDPVANPDVAADSKVTGFHSSALSNDNLIGPSIHYGAIRDNKTGSYDELSMRANETDSREYYAAVDVNLTGDADTSYGNGFMQHSDKTLIKLGRILRRDFEYQSIYKDFDGQMQIGHVLGDPKVRWTNITPGRLSNVHVQGNATHLDDMQYMKDLAQYKADSEIDDGKVQYKGVATYMENLHLKDGNRAGPVVDGTSTFDVDFINANLEGELAFNAGDYKYMPEGNKINIKADITGNAFAGKLGDIDTAGGFYGEDAQLLGGVYQQALTTGGVAKKKGEGTTFQGTFGASKVNNKDSDIPSEPQLPTVESDMTGFQSTALSSKEKTLPFGLGKLDNAIGYVEIRDDLSDFESTVDKDGNLVPVDNRKGDNFKSFDKGVVRGDMVKPDTVFKPIEVSLKQSGKVKVDAGKGSFNPTFNYNSVYKNFDQQMQVGHVYGNFDSAAGDVSRAANVYVQGYLTAAEAMDALKEVNEGKAQYTGVATYIENIHLADNANTAPVNGTSNFDVDFVNNSVKGELAFDGNFKYMPEGNKIGIEATIDGNTFAGNVNGIDTAGGFYGEEAKFLGGVYQDASVEGGKGTVAGTGTKFQGTFGAEKQ
ncbi:transferrin-binding protein-like solute binding protein [Psychrobacter sp. UBA3962]|uniref:transferrin-binding protein-like solute binding protein n=1 Tax=Psychrobacter sp. UBA3962 TaxID=1947352 RepID=UPI0025F6DCA0|nr:transferrin-binding protein-like solute binding protein [Psychrobacter sp. UBA3962]